MGLVTPLRPYGELLDDFTTAICGALVADQLGVASEEHTASQMMTAASEGIFNHSASENASLPDVLSNNAVLQLGSCPIPGRDRAGVVDA